MKRFLLIFIFTACLQCLPVISFSQGDDDDPGNPPIPSDVPVDGGLSVLLAAGIAYGVKKSREKHRKQSKEDEINY